MRALGVARVSTQEQAEGDRFSIPHQRQRITEYCLQRGWDLLGVVEYVQSGGSNYRELQEILRRVQRDHVQVVVVNELDRLARDMVSTLLFLEDLQKAGCRFAAVADELDLTTPDGELKMMILSVFAHYFRKQLARKVQGGLAERARQGKHHGGRPPYGYQFAGDKLAPHPEQAAVVRQIYAWYVQEGIGAREIAKRLNQRGIPTQTGRSLWAATEVRRLLRKPAYAGDLQHGALEFFRERTGVTHKRHKADALVVPNAHPALVDRATWEAAQRILKDRGQHSGRQATSPYLLSGLVFCGYCGRTMVVTRGGRRRRPRYTCRSYHTSGLCRPNMVMVDAVEAAVLERWLGQMACPDAEDIEAWLRWKTAQDRQADARDRERRQLQRRMEELASMQQRAEDALLQGTFTAEQFRQAQDRIQCERQRVEALLGELQAPRPLEPTPDLVEQLRRELAAVPDEFQRAGTLHERRQLLRRYVRRVEILEDEVRIHLAAEETAPEESG